MEYAGVNFVPTIHHDTYATIAPTKADLSGKVVVISGASKGIGRATALSYAKAGATGIAILARSSLSSLEKEIADAAKEAGRKLPSVLSLSVDTIDRAAVENAAQEVSAKFGKVDILINNAGYLETFREIADSDPDEWWYTWQVNVNGVYLFTKFFLPLVLKSDLKTLVMVSSIGAHLTTAGASAYQTAKLAILRMNDFLMEEYGQKGLLAFGIHPGGVVTELAKKMPQHIVDTLSDTPELAGDCLVWLTKERRLWLADRYISVNWDVDDLLAQQDEIIKGDLLKVRMRL